MAAFVTGSNTATLRYLKTEPALCIWEASRCPRERILLKVSGETAIPFALPSIFGRHVLWQKSSTPLGPLGT